MIAAGNTEVSKQPTVLHISAGSYLKSTHVYCLRENSITQPTVINLVEGS
jgi:hypothetical protein